MNFTRFFALLLPVLLISVPVAADEPRHPPEETQPAIEFRWCWCRQKLDPIWECRRMTVEYRYCSEYYLCRDPRRSPPPSSPDVEAEARCYRMDKGIHAPEPDAKPKKRPKKRRPAPKPKSAASPVCDAVRMAAL